MKTGNSEQIKEQFVAGLEGDGAAYEQALRALSDVLRAYIRKRLAPYGLESDVEDIVQNALIAIHDKRATYERTRLLMPWVYGISKYKLLQHLRADGRRRSIISDIQVETVPESFQVDETQEPSAAQDVSIMLDALSPEQRQAIDLTKLKGLSIKEAASHAGTSVSSMKVRVHRAMKRLQKRTEER